MRHYILLLSFLSVLSIHAQERQVVDMNFDWEFSRDSLFKDSRKIDIPHDFQIEQPWIKYPVDEKNNPIGNISNYALRGFKEMGTGWYLETTGEAVRLVAVTNGDICSDEMNVAATRHLWNGHVMAILRAGREKGKVVLRVKSRYKTISIPFQLE